MSLACWSGCVPDLCDQIPDPWPAHSAYSRLTHLFINDQCQGPCYCISQGRDTAWTKPDLRKPELNQKCIKVSLLAPYAAEPKLQGPLLGARVLWGFISLFADWVSIFICRPQVFVQDLWDSSGWTCFWILLSRAERRLIFTWQLNGNENVWRSYRTSRQGIQKQWRVRRDWSDWSEFTFTFSSLSLGKMTRKVSP